MLVICFAEAAKELYASAEGGLMALWWSATLVRNCSERPSPYHATIAMRLGMRDLTEEPNSCSPGQCSAISIRHLDRRSEAFDMMRFQVGASAVTFVPTPVTLLLNPPGSGSHGVSNEDCVTVCILVHR